MGQALVPSQLADPRLVGIEEEEENEWILFTYRKHRLLQYGILY